MNALHYNPTDYLPIVVFFTIALGIAVAIIIAAFFLGPQKPLHDKQLPFECGFDSIGSTRKKFDIRFYLVAILFIIFDIEIGFLIPWAVSLKSIGEVGFWSMMFFLGILIIGFIYEWQKGALEWE